MMAMMPCQPASWARFHPCAMATQREISMMIAPIASAPFASMNTPLRTQAKRKPMHVSRYSVRVIRPEKEKGALNIEKQGLTPKQPYYNPGRQIISP
jgi:hypothetical protein